MKDFDKEHYYNTKEFKALLDRYEKAACLGESIYLEPDDLTDIAEYYQDRGQDAEALHAIDRALATFPGALSPLLFRARYALLREGNPDEAQRYAAQIIDQNDFDYYYLVGEIMLYEGHADKAADYLADNMRYIDSDDLADYLFDVANLLIDYDADELASQWIDRYCDHSSKDYRDISATLLVRRQQYAQAEQLLTALTEEDPYSTYYWNLLAEAQYMQGRIQDAMQSCEFAIAIDPCCSEALLNKGNCLSVLAQNEKALEFYQRYIALRPNDALSEHLLANTLVRLGRDQEALPHYHRAMSLTHEDTNLKYEIGKWLARALVKMGNYDEAVRLVREMGYYPGANKCGIDVLKGYLCLVDGDTDEAITRFEKALDDSQFHADIIYMVGAAAYEYDLYDLAYDMFSRITTDIADEHPVTGWAYYAACCIELGKDQEALKALKTACETNPLEVSQVFASSLPEDIGYNDFYTYLKRKFTT